MIPAFITVRSTSGRLPRKCFLPFGDTCVLEHVIRRALHYGLAPIVCTTRDAEDDGIVELADRIGVPAFRGSTVHKLERWRDCCRAHGIDAFHTVDADDPFFCGDEVRRSFARLESGYDVVAPTPASSSGGATVGYSLRAAVIERACAALPPETDTEMMWSYLEVVEGLRKTTLDEPGDAIVRARLTLDYPEDYILLEALRLIAGNLATRQDIARILDENPALARINAFRSAEWAANQRSKSMPATLMDSQ